MAMIRGSPSRYLGRKQNLARHMFCLLRYVTSVLLLIRGVLWFSDIFTLGDFKHPLEEKL